MKSLLIIGVLLVLNAIIALIVSNINTGLIITFGLGVILIFYGIYYDWLAQKLPAWLRISFFAGVLLVVAFVAFLFVYGNMDNTTYDEDAVIVLGCGVNGEEPSESLKRRLESAISYYNKNTDVIIVVSGGKGAQEDITEALAMERYLVERGIPQDKIIKEEQSTSTYENFVYSKAILDEYFKREYTVSYITNDYHIFRAGNISKKVGYDNATHCSAGTPWYLAVTSGFRECIGIMKFVVLGE